MKKNDNTAKAVNRNVRSGTRKINTLLKNIRGKKADEAIKNLSFVGFGKIIILIIRISEEKYSTKCLSFFLNLNAKIRLNAEF